MRSYTMPDGAVVTCTADNVIVEVMPDAERQLASGIYAPGGNRKKGDAVPAVVRAVGPGYRPTIRLAPSRPRVPIDTSPTVEASKLVETTVRPGDRVLLDTGLAGQFLQERYRADGDFRMVRESEILAVIGQETQVG